MVNNNNQEAIDAINDLINSDGAIEIPGLSLEPIAENYVDTKYGAELAQIEDETERENMRQKWIKYYTEGEGKEALELEMINIKANVGAAQDQLKMVGEATTSAVASNTVPQVITTGEATSVPNPAHAMIENKTKKNQLLAMLKQVGTFLVNAIKSMIAICFAIPAMVIALIKSLTTAKKAVKSIPTQKIFVVAMLEYKH